MLKVIAGKNRGYKIKFLPSKKTRPTSNIVKESIFNIMQSDIAGSRFLDLFSGSGQIGIEAISRGAKQVTFVDNDYYCINTLRSNINKLNILQQCTIIKSDVMIYLDECDNDFDIVFLDPPYSVGLVEKTLNNVMKNVKKCDIIVETDKSEILDNKYLDTYIQKEYYYGRKKLTVYKRKRKY